MDSIRRPFTINVWFVSNGPDGDVDDRGMRENQSDVARLLGVRGQRDDCDG
jgi:hypothetical protein